MKRVISTVLLSGVIALAGGGTASATTYPAPAPGVSVSDGTVQVGEPITFSGTGFTPGEQINITVTNEAPQASGFSGGGGGRVGAVVGTIAPLETQKLDVVADTAGKFSTTVTLNETGTYQLTATGAQSGRSVTATVTVVPAPAAANASISDPNLAQTGAGSLLLWGTVGGLAVLGGAASVVIVRRKSQEV